MSPGIGLSSSLLENVKQEVFSDDEYAEYPGNGVLDGNLLKIEKEEIQEVKIEYEVKATKTSPTEKKQSSSDKNRPSARLPCDFCTKSARTYRNYKELQRHVERHHNFDQFAYKCDHCHTIIMQKVCLIAHMHKFHLGKEDNECPDCSKKFDAYIKLRRHLRTHYKQICRCEICHKQFEDKKIMRKHFEHHLARHHGFKCFSKGCNQYFGSYKNANSHYKKHLSRVTCPLCGKSCASTGVLTTHLALHEANGDTRSNLYQCDLCTHKFEEKSWLEIHMNYKHLGNSNHLCPVCNDEFKTHQLLIQHVKRHTIQFKCKICSKLFMNQSGLSSHKKVHFPTEEVFKCDFPACDKSYSRRECLMRHKLNHENIKKFKCQICSMRFVLKHGLTNHMIAHQKTKPFKCSKCGLSFKTNILLRNHQYVHTDARPFGCPNNDCPKTYKRHGELARHLKNAHKNRKSG